VIAMGSVVNARTINTKNITKTLDQGSGRSDDIIQRRGRLEDSSLLFINSIFSSMNSLLYEGLYPCCRHNRKYSAQSNDHTYTADVQVNNVTISARGGNTTFFLLSFYQPIPIFRPQFASTHSLNFDTFYSTNLSI
jgi:hypothetical protein